MAFIKSSQVVWLLGVLTLFCPVDAYQGLVDFYDCTGKPDGNYVHPFECGKFIACVAGTYAYEIDCVQGLHYNPATDSCEYPDDVGCTIGQETSTVIPTTQTSTVTVQTSTSAATNATTVTVTEQPSTAVPTTTVETTQTSTSVPTTNATSVTVTEQPSTSVGTSQASTVTTTNATATAQPTQPTTSSPPLYYNCSGLPDGNYKHPTDCGKFISCVAQEYFYEMECPAGLHYDPSSNRCDYPEVVGCDNSTVTNATTPPSITTSIPDPDTCNHDCEYVGIDCHKYYTCVNFTRKEYHECSKQMGLAFNPDLQVCDRIENVQGCGDDVTTEQPATTPEPDCGCEYKADESDCSRFFFCPNACNSSSCERRRCPGDLLWSIDVYGDGSFHQQCTVASEASCASNNSGSARLEFSCYGRENGMYRNERDCRTYWKCNAGMTLLYDCPEGFIYNPDMKQCDFSGKSLRFCDETK